MRASRLAWLLALALAVSTGAEGAEPPKTQKVKVGIIKLTSSTPVFVGMEKGFFREAGVEPELIYFQAAQPVAVAIASGDIEVGATGLTAGLYNIVAGGERLWVVADMIRVGFPYQDRDARLDVPDIDRQLGWYHKTGMVTTPLVPRDLVDASFLDEALKTLPR